MIQPPEGCPVTVYVPTLRYGSHTPARCGLPLDGGNLCAKHAAERVRLGGGR